jgi:hypothetical protein
VDCAQETGSPSKVAPVAAPSFRMSRLVDLIELSYLIRCQRAQR